MTQTNLKPFRPVFILFVILSAFFVVSKNLLDKWGVDRDVLIIGNLLLIIVTLVSYLVLCKGLNASNPNSFVRAMYGSFILKFFVIALSAFIYILVAKKDVNKPALIACMFLYLLYTFLEVSVLTKLLKQKKNA